MELNINLYAGAAPGDLARGGEMPQRCARLSCGRGVPLGVENMTLSQCARCTKNTPCHNIPY